MKRLAAALLVLLLAGAVLLVVPLPVPRFPSRPRPAASHDEALRRVAAIRARDGAEVAAECRTLLLDHGARAPRAVVLLHGLTNCPEQFRVLGERLHAGGANVYVPRLPEHGLADRMTTALGRLRASALTAATDEAVDVARGLGDSVIVVGLSIGGTMAAWAAQERADVTRAVPLAPLLGAGPAARVPTGVAMRLGLALPNGFIWWDPRLKRDLPGPRHVYPRFSTRSVAETMRLGAAVLAAARHAPPRAGEVVMVTVGGDRAVDGGAIERLVRSWRGHGARVRTYAFPAALGLNHDIVDPEQVGGNPALVHPVLERLIAP